jgi:hydrogenase-4 component B
MTESVILLSIALVAVSGVPGLLSGRTSRWGQWLTTLLAVGGSLLGLVGVGYYWTTGDSAPISRPWPLIDRAAFSVGVDGLSAFFLVPIFLISLLGQVYGLGYWTQTSHPRNGRKLGLFYGLLTAGMALLVVSRNAILFLFGWELMALAAFFLITTEDENEDARVAGWVYFVATHVSTLCLFGLFAALRSVTGTFDLTAVDPARLSPGMGTAIFVLALVGFGIKAGIMPLHVWLPAAHATAPSHVSALMSGVFIKMGVYGLVRVLSLLPTPPVEWGVIVLALGATSGVLGIAFALAQHDLKRLLAYSSIENIGIIVMALGLSLIGRSLNRPDWIVLGLAGCLLHVWNHALFKALLFLGAGSIIHATGTRQIDSLGGLAKRMPRTALCFLVGVLAVCGLPPLNGFLSEFLVYLGLFGTLGKKGVHAFPGAAFAVPALALIGALALACFVKVYGMIFLGTPRSEHATHAHDAPPSMAIPMVVLVVCCFLIGLQPLVVVPAVEEALFACVPDLAVSGVSLVTLAPLDWLTLLAWVLLGALVVVGFLLWLRLRSGAVAETVTWGCGYARPTPRMQYTGSSFVEMLVNLFGWALRPRTHAPEELPIFPQEADFHSTVPETVLDEAILPAVGFGSRLFSWFRVFQGGAVQVYLLYIFLAVIGLMLWR